MLCTYILFYSREKNQYNMINLNMFLCIRDKSLKQMVKYMKSFNIIIDTLCKNEKEVKRKKM